MRVSPIKQVQAKCLMILKDHIDTDQIIPARFLYKSRADGFEQLLFHDFLTQLPEAERGPLQDIHAKGTPKILLAGQNFGCGSSREQAVWALIDSGFKVVIAKSFGDIFYGNAINNGLVAIQLPELFDSLAGEINNAESLFVDLENQQIKSQAGKTYPFQMDPFFKNMLIQGAQELDMTLQLLDKIKAFEQRHDSQFPWLQHPSSKNKGEV
jgi:3-isopropylmalate/(R)-2-methylmalate dehydratase small subunit